MNKSKYVYLVRYLWADYSVNGDIMVIHDNILVRANGSTEMDQGYEFRYVCDKLMKHGLLLPEDAGWVAPGAILQVSLVAAGNWESASRKVTI